MLAVEAGAPLCEFSVVWGNGETSLLNLSLVDSNAPKGEQFDVSIDNPLIETLVPAVLADVLLSSRPACKYEGKGGGQVRCEDCIAKEGGREKGAEAFKIRKAAVCCGGSGGGSHIVDCQTVGDVPGGGNGHLDGVKCCLVVNNEGES